ncbi:hypothetical protein BOX15_Mlig022290g3, partial [Macrostomum lignano]
PPSWKQQQHQQQHAAIQQPCYQQGNQQSQLQQCYYLAPPLPPAFHLPPPPHPPPPPPPPAPPPPQPCSELFIGNLPPTATKSDLTRELSRFGPLEHVSLAYGPGGGFRGFAFAKFARIQSAIGLVDGRGHGLMLDGRLLRIEWRRKGVGSGSGGGVGSGVGDAPPTSVSTFSAGPVMVSATATHQRPAEFGEYSFASTNPTAASSNAATKAQPVARCQHQQRHHLQQQHTEQPDCQLPAWLHTRLVEDTERLVDCLLAELRLCNRLAATTSNPNEAAQLRQQARELESRMQTRSAELANLNGAGCLACRSSRNGGVPNTKC